MRNRVLADELRRRTPGVWVEFAVCRHPANQVVNSLKESVAGSSNGLEAFRRLSSSDSVRDWNAREVLEHTCSADEEPSDWRSWMLDRYFPAPDATDGRHLMGSL
jgi:hypothetical protein